jgi:hypothetical protein
VHTIDSHGWGRAAQDPLRKLERSEKMTFQCFELRFLERMYFAKSQHVIFVSSLMKTHSNVPHAKGLAHSA